MPYRLEQIPGVVALEVGALVVVPAAFLLALLLAGALAVVWLYRPLPAAWTERARLAAAVRALIAVPTLALALGGGALAATMAPRIGIAPHAMLGVSTGVAAFVGGDLVRLVVECRLRSERIPTVGWFAWKALWLLIFGVQLVPVTFALLLSDNAFDRRTGVVVAGTMAAVLALGTGGLWLLLAAVGILRRAPPRVVAAVERASSRNGVYPRAIWLIPTYGVPFANAFALPLLRRVAFTDDAAALLDDDELEAIAAHELGHLSEPMSVIVARLAQSVSYLPLILGRPLAGTFGPAAMAVVPVLFLLGTRLSARRRRIMEERADAIAHRHDGPGAHAGHVVHDDPRTHAYAHALEKLYARNLVPAVQLGKGRVHPDLWDRMVAAGAKPAYAKPAPPKMRGAMLNAIVAALLGALTLGTLDGWVRTTADRRAADLIAAEARARLDRGAVGEAYLLYERVLGLYAQRLSRAALAVCEARMDLCDEAAMDAASARYSKLIGPAPESTLVEADLAIADCRARRARGAGLGPPEDEDE